MWAATMTRLDSSFTAHNLAEYSDNQEPAKEKEASKVVPQADLGPWSHVPGDRSARHGTACVG